MYAPAIAILYILMEETGNTSKRILWGSAVMINVVNMNIQRENTDVCLLMLPIDSQFHGRYALSTTGLVGGRGAF